MASKSEVKHRKQKAKLENSSGQTIEITPFVQKPTEKQIWAEKCQKAGFDCTLKNSILMFGISDQSQKKKILDFLNVSYTEENSSLEMDLKTLPPFSFGFCPIGQISHMQKPDMDMQIEESA